MYPKCRAAPEFQRAFTGCLGVSCFAEKRPLQGQCAFEAGFCGKIKINKTMATRSAMEAE